MVPLGWQHCLHGLPELPSMGKVPRPGVVVKAHWLVVVPPGVVTHARFLRWLHPNTPEYAYLVANKNVQGKKGRQFFKKMTNSFRLWINNYLWISNEE